MNTIDPCEASPVSGPNVAALVIGRSLTRFRYHLTQAVLLATGEYVPTGQLSSRAQAQRVLESINARLRCLSLDRIDEIHNLLHDCSDEITGSSFSGACCEAVTWLDSECNYDQDKDTERKDIVDQFATPWLERLYNALCRAIQPDGVRWFELGQKLEEGLCRPDIYQFQTPYQNRWPVLRPDGYSTPYLESLDLSWWSDDEENAPSQCATQITLPRVSYVRRDPGDLAPHRFWWTDVERVWTTAGLDMVHIDQLRVLRKAKANRLTITAMLNDFVEKLFHAAHFAAGKGLERLRVDLQNSVVELDGKPYREDKAVVFLLHELIEDNGKTSFPRVKRKYSDVYGQHDKLCRVLKKASPPIQALIGHGRGHEITLLL